MEEKEGEKMVKKKWRKVNKMRKEERSKKECIRRNIRKIGRKKKDEDILGALTK